MLEERPNPVAAEQNVAVVCTIHQPPASVFADFDNTMVLSMGRVAYFGKAEKMGAYLAGVGFPLPADTNPAEFILDLVNKDFTPAAGVRRVEAITGENALSYLRDTESKLKAAGDLVRAGRDDLADKIQLALDRSKTLEKELAALKAKLASSAGGDLASQARDIKGVKVIAAKVDGVDGNELRNLMDQLKDKLKSGIVLLGSASGPKVSLIAGVTSDLIGKVKAGELVSYAASQVGGKGGGKPEMAQAGGTQPEKLPEAIESAYGWLEGKL